MIATSFPESNMVMDKPDELTREQCEALSVLYTQTTDGLPCFVSCWKMTREELEEVNRTGRVWLTVLGGTMPPVAVDGAVPFRKI